jgi:DNA-binding CsgD family transcriptional regulator
MDAIIDNKESHRYVLDNVSYVNQICNPIFDKLQINYFSYGRFYDDNSFQVLVSNPDWYEHFWRANHKLSTPKLEDFLKKDSAIYLWEDSLREELVKDAKQFFHMDNGLTIIRRVPRYFEYFSFAFSKDEKTNVSTYLNHLKILELFGNYFIEKAYDLIQSGQCKRIRLPHEKPTYIDIPKLSISEWDLFSEESIEGAEHKKILPVSFNTREIDCLHIIKKVFTVKKMADVLCLSPRTIEDYIVSIRQKLGCQKKSEIISVLEKL